MKSTAMIYCVVSLATLPSCGDKVGRGVRDPMPDDLVELRARLADCLGIEFDDAVLEPRMDEMEVETLCNLVAQTQYAAGILDSAYPVEVE